MKVYLFIKQKKRSIALYKAYFEAMSKHMSVSPTLEDADIVLLFGAWSAEGARVARKAVKMGIPYVVCPLGDISPRNNANPYMKRHMQTACFQKKMCWKANLLVATTPMEYAWLQKLGWNKSLVLIRYFSYSKLTALETMVGEWKDVCSAVINAFEERKTKMIAGKTKDAIVAQILQIQSRMPHKNIPQQYLDNLHTLLYADNYDEDALCHELARLKLTAYAASVFEVMSVKTGLTEGFMPLPAHEGRKSREILDYVK